MDTQCKKRVKEPIIVWIFCAYGLLTSHLNLEHLIFVINTYDVHLEIDCEILKGIILVQRCIEAIYTRRAEHFLASEHHIFRIYRL